MLQLAPPEALQRMLQDLIGLKSFPKSQLHPNRFIQVIATPRHLIIQISAQQMKQTKISQMAKIKGCQKGHPRSFLTAILYLTNNQIKSDPRLSLFSTIMILSCQIILGASRICQNSYNRTLQKHCLPKLSFRSCKNLRCMLINSKNQHKKRLI